MVFGSFAVAFCLFILGWTAEIVGLFVKDPEKVRFLSFSDETSAPLGELCFGS
jgi:hypothetical protein